MMSGGGSTDSGVVTVYRKKRTSSLKVGLAQILRSSVTPEQAKKVDYYSTSVHLLTASTDSARDCFDGVYRALDIYLEIAKTFWEKGIPCDVIWMDIDYMDGFRCFTFDKVCFSKYI
ncbi:hypothetical protein Taro_000487 [Colocasia esculenta]|uniref:Glycoside hydrolase family 31 TIM barrel domain-containing protein n=1 Tax=Colocasia esculenta TaxID=4460 RepID=A0A843T813_COLES|nr:hypothetical protein [Colocasia esculenta]